MSRTSDSSFPPRIQEIAIGVCRATDWTAVTPPLASPHGPRAAVRVVGSASLSPDQVRVLVLYSHPLMGEGLGRMLAAEPGVVVTAVDIAETDAVNAAIASEPEVIVVEEGGAVDAADIVRRSTLRPGPGRGHHHHQRLVPAPRDALDPTRRLPCHHPRRHRRSRRRARRTAACSRRRFPARLSPDMGDTTRRPAGDTTTFDPRTTPVPRRHVLVLMGVGTVAVSGGLGAILAGCAGPPVTVTLDIDPADLEVGVPMEVPFTLVEGGSSTPASTWLVKKASGELIAYDPRCTHAQLPLRLVRRGRPLQVRLPRRPVRARRGGPRGAAAAAAVPLADPGRGRHDRGGRARATSRRRRSRSRPDGAGPQRPRRSTPASGRRV